MKHTARSDKEKLKEFEAQIAALKAALKKEHESAVALEKAIYGCQSPHPHNPRNSKNDFL